MKLNLKSRKGFTLIELLVVIGILAVLAAIAIPSVAGLIDRANVSADNTNANEMTNAIERFVSEYELYCQDIQSGCVDVKNLSAIQSRVYDVIKTSEWKDIKYIESNGLNGILLDETTKYPINKTSAKSIIRNYMKTSSSTFEPKQSDCNYYYSPDCGIVVCAETDKASIEELNKLVVSGKDSHGQELNINTRWVNLTSSEFTTISKANINDFKGISGGTPGNYFWTDGKNIYFSLNGGTFMFDGNSWQRIDFSGDINKLSGLYVWYLDDKVYYSYGTNQYMLNNNVWEKKEWEGTNNFSGYGVWTDGQNVYLSNGYSQYVLIDGKWEEKDWGRLPKGFALGNFYGNNVWNYNNNSYYSYSGKNFILVDGKWEIMEWGEIAPYNGQYVWTDGENMYYDSLYVLRGNKWEIKNWEGDLKDFNGGNTFLHNGNYYVVDGFKTYIFS